MHLVFFIYGLAFFLFGFSIIVYPKKETGVALAGDIWLLAVFGIIHGSNEWLDMLRMGLPPDGGGLGHVLLVARTITLVTSFLFLLAFGVRVIVRMKDMSRLIYTIPLALTGIWATLTFTSNGGFFTQADILARYLLGLPGIALTAYALSLNIPDARRKGINWVELHLHMVVGAFICYAFFAGMVVPEADFFPANVLNYHTFTEAVDVPVQVLRAGCAAAAAYGMLWVLRVFTWRTRVQLEHSRDVLEHKVLERTLELRALNEELEHEVSEKTEYERELLSSLVQKEALLRELHHRVKNNMQIMVSLLKLENRFIDDSAYARLFTKSTNRLNAMITIQERLYAAEDFGRVDFASFVKDLSRTVFRLYSADVNRIRLIVDTAGVSLLPDTVVPVGMVVQELMANSITHGFPDDRRGEIHITAHGLKDGLYELLYRDTGTGLPQGFDLNSTNTMGLELVKLLCSQQLRGSVEASNFNGAVFTIRFREPQYRERI